MSKTMEFQPSFRNIEKSSHVVSLAGSYAVTHVEKPIINDPKTT
jgi:hypothetical protein